MQCPYRPEAMLVYCRYWSEEGKLKSRSGTPVYMAPEVILQVGCYEHKLQCYQDPMRERSGCQFCPAAERKPRDAPLRSAVVK